MKNRARAVLIWLALPGSLWAGPYPGQLSPHGHSSTGDGGVIQNLNVGTKFSVGGSSITANGSTLQATQNNIAPLTINGSAGFPRRSYIQFSTGTTAATGWIGLRGFWLGSGADDLALASEDGRGIYFYTSGTQSHAVFISTEGFVTTNNSGGFRTNATTSKYYVGDGTNFFQTYPPVNVVKGSFSASVTISSAGYQATGYSISVTNKFVGSTVIVDFSCHATTTGGFNQGLILQAGGSTTIAQQDVSTTASSQVIPMALHGVDTPASASATTYAVKIKGGGGNLVLNQSGATCWLTAIEYAP